jgi:hypothetical protein
MRNSGFFGFYIQLSFGTIQNLPKNLLAVPLGAFSGDFPSCLIGPHSLAAGHASNNSLRTLCSMPGLLSVQMGEQNKGQGPK